MSAVISALTDTTTGLSANSFFSVIADAMPFVVLIVPVALGFTVLRKLIRGSGKAKVRV